MAKVTKEVRIAHTSVPIFCTKSVGGAPSVMKTPIKSVGISKGLASTEKDIAPSTHIVPFVGCNYMGQCLACVPAGKWKLTAEDALNVVKRVPLVEDSEFDCTARGGKITFNFDPVKTVPPANKKPNIVDKAKAKINSTVNTAVKKATEALQTVTEDISGAFDGLKPVLENTKAANLANTLDTQLQKLNQLKKETDNRVEELDKEITELRKKIEAKLTGKTYQPPKPEAETELVISLDKDKIDLQNAEEEKRNEALYNQSTNDAIKAYEDYINSQITPTVTVREVEVTADATNQATSAVNSPATAPNKTNVQNPNNLYVMTAKEYLEKLAKTSDTLGLKKNKDTQNALLLLDTLGTTLSSDIATNVKDRAQNIIKNGRATLNGQVQAKIDEELKELGYYEKLKKYQSESKDLQEDIDKASLGLKAIGNFGGFIDGLKNKYLGKIGAKYSESLNKLSNNLAMLNTSLDGLSYVADGFPKGEVFTNVIREIDEEDNEDENGEGNGDGSIFGSLQNVLNDRNKEPKILRIYAIYADDGEDYNEGDIITAESILPDIPVYLVIQSNGKANGKKVDLDLQDRTFHYIQDGKNKDDTDRIIENITLQGDSPDFEKGGKYDLSDPNFAINPEPIGRRKLNDKTNIKFISRLPIEEEQEEPLT